MGREQDGLSSMISTGGGCLCAPRSSRGGSFASDASCMRLGVPRLPLPGQKYSDASPERLLLRYDWEGMTPRWGNATRRRAQTTKAYMDVIALNDPIFLEAITAKARSVRSLGSMARTSFSPSFTPQVLNSNPPPMPPVTEQSSEEDMQLETCRTKAASESAPTARPQLYIDLQDPPGEALPTHLQSPATINIPDFSEGSRSRQRIAALQALLGGEGLVEKHGKEMPKEAPWLMRTRNDEEAEAAAARAAPVLLPFQPET